MIGTTTSCEKYIHNQLTGGCIILDGRMEDKTLPQDDCRDAGKPKRRGSLHRAAGTRR
jgi:hypothetical protein